MTPENEERLNLEVDLLESMYPESFTFHRERREIDFRDGTESLTLRVVDGYLEDALPEVVAATVGKIDLRDRVKGDLTADCQRGEEVLDFIISSFQNIAADTLSSLRAADDARPTRDELHTASKKATVIVWLHHLLNTNKRKQALSPASGAVNGLTKPGYPGVLIYSGPSDAVHEHVGELKQLNWQAFQVRYEADEEWCFAHGAGVREVEAMKEVVAEISEDRKDVFLEAMRMK